MARKKKHEEHANHEAWAIPYGDLVTLLFALFTVMYAMSSVNEGKFRVLSDSLIAAFHGAPKSMQPVNIGEKEPGKGGEKPLTGVTPTVLMKIREQGIPGEGRSPRDPDVAQTARSAGSPAALIRMEREVQNAMQALIDAKLVTVRRESLWLEIEINTDILFPSGVADFAPAAAPVLDKLADVLKPFPNPIRVEGHTDNRPIKTAPIRPTGSCRRRARRVSCTNSPRSASIRCGSRSSASASSIRARPTIRSRGATRIAGSRSWCSKRWRPAIRSPRGPPRRSRRMPRRAWSRRMRADAANRLLWRVPPADLARRCWSRIMRTQRGARRGGGVKETAARRRGAGRGGGRAHGFIKPAAEPMREITHERS